MSPGAVLEEIEALPAPQAKASILYGDGQADGSEHGAHVGGRVVGAFQSVHMPRLRLRGQALHELLHIQAGAGVVTLLDEERRAGVGHEEVTQAFCEAPFPYLCLDLFGEGVQTFAARLDFKRGFVPVHSRPSTLRPAFRS